jgi:NAD-dependent SIR2 family protein deacetylase
LQIDNSYREYNLKILKNLQHPPQRDIVFILGAGASHPDGVPLQKDILPHIISKDSCEIQNSEIGKIVIQFIKDNFKLDENNNLYPELEAVFGFIDYFIQYNESLNSKYTNEKIIHIKELLIKLIHYIVNLETDKNSRHYNEFWKSLFEYSPNSSIITLNYDTLLEQSFEFLFKKYGYLDYCIPFMNYEKKPQLAQYDFWINPREPVFVEESENPIPFKVIKLHGSLNWKYCNCCNQTLLTPWDRKIDLTKGKFLGYTYPDKHEYEFLCPIDHTEFQTLIMPPSYLKSLHHPIITQLLNETARELRTAKKVVFIGYSLSSADVHIKALLKKNIHPDMEIIVVNPKKKDLMELNYRSLSQNVVFKYCSFEEMLSDDSLLKSIYSKKEN